MTTAPSGGFSILTCKDPPGIVLELIEHRRSPNTGDECNCHARVAGSGMLGTRAKRALRTCPGPEG
jgi:hypothetical protein